MTVSLLEGRERAFLVLRSVMDVRIAFTHTLQTGRRTLEEEGKDRGRELINY